MDLKIAKSLKREICEKYKIVPIGEDANSIIVLSIEDSQEANDYLKFIYNKNVSVVKIEESNYEHLKNIIFGEENRDLQDVIIFNAIDKKASDIHFEPQGNCIYVRYRINGSLVVVHKIDFNEYTSLVSRIKIKANMDITEKRRPQDGKIIVDYNDLKYDLRISSIPVVYGELLDF